MDKVIPQGINYADIKPEAIQNQIKLVKFTPTATINYAKPNDVVRFMLQGNGFYDPYSSYIRAVVSVAMTDFVEAEHSYFAGRFLDRSAHSLIHRLVIKSQGTEVERIEQYDIIAAMINDMYYSQEQKLVHHFEGFPTKQFDSAGGFVQVNRNSANHAALLLGQYNQNTTWRHMCDQGFWKVKNTAKTNGLYDQAMVAEIEAKSPYLFGNSKYFHYENSALKMDPYHTVLKQGEYVSSPELQEFCFPIYSGVIGVLQPTKKMLPLSLVPLEVEFTINPHAFYDVGVTEEFKGDVANLDFPIGQTFPVNIKNSRQYLVRSFDIFSHVLYFEQELHRSLEAVTAQAGIFIHFNSFYLAPISSHVNNTTLQYAQINVHAKSINSVHFVFIYQGFEQPFGPRKLHFVNHNLSFLQIRNGTDLIPSEPIQSNQYTGKMQGAHSQYLLETYKAWNKMHDPTTDSAIDYFSYVTDSPLSQIQCFGQMLDQQGALGRCQYAITLEGEELGTDQTIITGRKGLVPFDINIGSSQKMSDKTSFQFTFIKADYVLFVRPDLVVTVLGR